MEGTTVSHEAGASGGRRPTVLVVGNEGRGLRPLVEKHCDFRLTIPVRAGTSLNVSAATAVALYELTRGSPLPMADAPSASRMDNED